MSPDYKVKFGEAERYLTLGDASGSGKGTGNSLRQALIPGTDLAGFTIMDCLHEGQFAAVFHARNTTADQEVALKIMEVEDKGAELFVSQLINDFQNMASVTDLSHVVRVHQPVLAQFGFLKLVLMPMEFADGGNLRKWLVDSADVEKRMPEAIRLFREICQGVQALHDKGVIHLDLKPENILLFCKNKTDKADKTNQIAKVADAGIARRIVNPRSGLPIPHATTGTGTPGYMSPEQADPTTGEIGPASDIYSLGVILFELVSGRHPPSRKNAKGESAKLASIRPPEIIGTGSYWNGIVRRCLSLSPHARFPSVAVLLKELDRIERGGPDVSCPSCGHVNIGEADDLLKRECQECGGKLPTQFFRACPDCHLSVRLDLDSCPRCKSEISVHYRAKDLWTEIGRAKDEEPGRAVNLISVMLTEKLGDREELLSLIQQMESTQKQIVELRKKIEGFSRHGEFEKAIQTLDDILRLAPRHVFATDEVNRLRCICEEEREVVGQISHFMDSARFAEAFNLLTERLSVTPGRRKLHAIGEKCRNRESEYLAAIKLADESRNQKRLYEAEQHLRKALSIAGASDEATRLHTEVIKIIEENEKLLKTVQESLATADFSTGDKALTEIESTQSDITALAFTRSALDNGRKRYPVFIAAADAAEAAADLPTAITELKNALKVCPNSEPARKRLEKLISDQSKNQSPVTVPEADIHVAVQQPVDLYPNTVAASSSRTTELPKTDTPYTGRHENIGTRIAIIAIIPLIVACIWLGAHFMPKSRPVFGRGEKQQESDLLLGRQGLLAPPPSSVPTPAVQESPVHQLTLSNVSIPEEVVKAGEVMNRFYGLSQSNGNVVVVSLTDALAIEKALHTYASGMNDTFRTHWLNGSDLFRRRRDGENPTSYGVERQEARRKSFRQATTAFQEAAATFGIPLIRNRNGQWLGPTWAYCISQPIYPDGYRESTRGGGVLKFKFPYRQYYGNCGNWIKLMRSEGEFNGNLSAFGGWAEMKVSGPSEADIYIRRRLDMRLDMLIIPAVQMDVNSGNDGMHDFYGSKHGVILGRVRLRMIGDSPTVLFDVPCSADASGTQDLDWKGALNYDAIPAWPTTL